MMRAILIAWIVAFAALAGQVVQGHVVNSATGAGAPGVRVRLLPAGDSPAGQQYETTTDAQGRFRIEGVDEGEYSASYTADDFVPVPGPAGVPAPFAVAGGGEPVSLELKLQPLGKLSGRVLDAAGKPVPNAVLWLIHGDRWCKPPACFPVYVQSKTNEKGDFALSHVLPGPWLLSATVPPSWDPPESRGDGRLAWAQTFYPGVTDPQLAAVVTVKPGGEIWNLDIKLAAAGVHRVRGRILDTRGNPVPKASVALGKGFSPELTQDTQGDGTFEFPAVVDDEWRLSASAVQEGVKLKAAQFVEINGHDLENIELLLAGPFSLRGQIVLDVPEGVPAPYPPAVDFELVSGAALLPDATDAFIHIDSDEEGQLTARDVYAGTYEINPSSDSAAPYFLDSIRLGDRDALGEVSIVADAPPLIVTYKLGGGTVRGTTNGCITGHVLLIPQDKALRRAGFLRITECGQNGRFEFPAVRPGEYYGLAVAGDPGPFAAMFWDDDFLKQAGSVTVRANECTSTEIPLIAQ